MKVCVIGLGYIGLPTAALLANGDFEVVGIDINKDVVRRVNHAEIEFLEPEVGELVRSAIDNGRLKAQMYVEEADVFLIAVPTPLKENNTADLSFVFMAISSIAEVIKANDLILIESTCPVGTTKIVVAELTEKRPDLNFPEEGGKSKDGQIRIAYCPERVLPGQIVYELKNIDRLIGGYTHECSQKAYYFYSKFVDGDCITTDSETAELCKLVENSYRDTNIAFANEVSMICDAHKIDPWALIGLANHHPRVNILQPGPGVGGHCIAVDPWFICETNEKEAILIRTAREVNNQKPRFVLEQIARTTASLEKPIGSVVVSCFGLTFKRDVADLRQSPALEIVNALAALGFLSVLISEPHIDSLPTSLESRGCWLVPLEEAIELADMYVLLVDHKEFEVIDREKIEGKPLVDTRGIWT